MKAYYPGSFNPPTYGHLEVLEKACEILDEVVVVCSVNPGKQYQLTQEERKQLWLHGYSLPPNCTVATFDELKENFDPAAPKLMVRGVRSAADLPEEMEVIEYNRRHFGFQNFLIVYTDDKFHDTSSSAFRQAAAELDFETMAQLASPYVVGQMLERILKAQSLWLVVGPPAGGKSTLLKALQGYVDQVYVVTTDSFNQLLKPVLEAKFPGNDLVEMAAREPQKVANAVKDDWFRLLANELRAAPAGSDIFVECAYGLCPDKLLYRFLGNRCLYIGTDANTHRQRNSDRGSHQLEPFLSTIPFAEESQEICWRANVHLELIDSSGSQQESTARIYHWYDYYLRLARSLTEPTHQEKKVMLL